MNQSFTAEQLLKICKKSEFEDYKISYSALEDKIRETFDRISDGSFEFNIVSANNFYYTEDLVNKLILRKLNKNIKSLYKDEQSNRRLIVKQVYTLLSDNCPTYILKTDIQKFYESVNRDRLLEKLLSDSMLSYHSIWLIKKLFAHPLLAHSTGLPKGITISSTLSEIYMRKFDRWIRVNPNVYYYARFVDDIIIFSNRESTVKEIKDLMNLNLEEGLKQNPDKTKIFNGNNIKSKRPLEFLGYNFTTSDTTKNKSVAISIADKKVKKIKSRIVYTFADFIKTKDFPLLENRVKFLTGNYSIRSSKRGEDLKAGIYYNYSFVNTDLVFKNLNLFFYKTLHSKKNKFGSRLCSALSKIDKTKLSKYSFLHGFEKKVYHSFTARELNQIKNCWR